ncbi:MAG: hypothetical protein HRU46_07005 [Verrucomicrobiales bacterium]|nr:hypothetical protein [Verrucomicrobiales bacterium]
MKFLPAALPTLLLGFLWSFSLFVTAEVRMDGNPYLIARLVPHAAKLSILKGSNRPTTSSGIYWRRLYRPTEVKEHRERYGKNSQLIERSSLSNGPLGALSFHSSPQVTHFSIPLWFALVFTLLISGTALCFISRRAPEEYLSS